MVSQWFPSLAHCWWCVWAKDWFSRAGRWSNHSNRAGFSILELLASLLLPKEWLQIYLIMTLLNHSAHISNISPTIYCCCGATLSDSVEPSVARLFVAFQPMERVELPTEPVSKSKIMEAERAQYIVTSVNRCRLTKRWQIMKTSSLICKQHDQREKKNDANKKETLQTLT